MTELIQWFLNPLIHGLIWGSFLIYCMYHQYMIVRVSQRHCLDLRFYDRLFLFRFPIWHTRTHITDAALTEVRHLARQFTFVFLLLLLFYVVMIAIAIL